MTTLEATPALPKRHALRQLADDLGIPTGPRPPGSRLIAVVFDGSEVVADCDVSIRHGDELILAESPAPIADHLHQEMVRATPFGGLTCPGHGGDLCPC